MHVPGNVQGFIGMLVSLLLFVVVPLGIGYWRLLRFASRDQQGPVRGWKEPCGILIGLMIGNGTALWLNQHLNSDRFFGARPMLVLTLLLLIDLPFLLFIFDHLVAYYALQRSKQTQAGGSKTEIVSDAPLMPQASG